MLRGPRGHVILNAVAVGRGSTAVGLVVIVVFESNRLRGYDLAECP